MVAIQTWQEHTQRYDNRVRSLLNIDDFWKEEASHVPGGPLSYTPSPEGLLKLKLCLLVFNAGRSGKELCHAIHLQWMAGRFLPASLCVRLLLEIYGSLVYAEQKVLKLLEDTGDLVRTTGRMQRLSASAKSKLNSGTMPASLPPADPINVMEFVRAAEGRSPGAMEMYEFLCDAAHPSVMQHFALLMAGPEYDNWSNPTLEREAHRILEFTLQAAELSVREVYRVGDDIFKRCLPQVTAEHNWR
jgi:hypothetical protein